MEEIRIYKLLCYSPDIYEFFALVGILSKEPFIPKVELTAKWIISLLTEYFGEKGEVRLAFLLALLKGTEWKGCLAFVPLLLIWSNRGKLVPCNLK